MTKRIISAIVIIALLILVLYVKGPLLYIMGILLALQSYKEISALDCNKNIPFYLKIIGALCTLLLTFCSIDYHDLNFGINYKVLSVIILTILVPAIFSKTYTMKDALLHMGFIILLGLVYNILVLVISFNVYMFVYLIMITILTDTFAMFGGMLIGKHKLIPSVSPKKTVEGSLVGTIVAVSVGFIYYKNIIGIAPWYVIIPVTLLFSIVGQLGDLLFSKIKRENDIKDYSNIIPGHGGVLDRLDSIILVMVIYIIFASFI